MKQFVKKTLAMLVAVMMLCALSVAAYAEEPNGLGRGQSVGFVDEDGDGVCDNFGFGRGSGQRRGQGAGFVDEDGDGVCDYYGTGRGRGQGAGFVDEDGDGVCDYFGTGRGSGQGRGQGRGQRNR